MKDVSIEQFCDEGFKLECFRNLIYKSFGAELKKIESGFESLNSLGYKKISSYHKICEKIPLDIGSLAVFAFEVSSISAKVGLHTELKRFITEYADGASSALACFYDPRDPKHFRLSLLNFELKDGKLINNNLKRQSFMLGTGLKNKTAILRLNDLKKDKIKEIQTLKEIFSVEAVTKEFFQEISSYFLKFTKEISFPVSLKEEEKRQFALRLIARILFCKFLEKKEVIPKKIFCSKDFSLSKDYYHEVLEPLFFLTLNTKQKARDYGLLQEEIHALLEPIPYLNGGLFQPHEQDYFSIKNPMAYINTLKVPTGALQDFLQMLERFHFTIDESTPIDQEVGLDPEMLGMVFENLLSVLYGNDQKYLENLEKSLQEDSKKNKRKETGSYYTPREIVSYMVKNSILGYLKTQTKIEECRLKTLIFDKESKDESQDLFSYEEKLDILKALQTFKVLDPACGSGAFPMGMLQEICEILEILDPKAKAFMSLQNEEFKKENQGKTPSYLRKLSVLRNNIYGIDIQPIATEIARLRCFLSLICDEDKDHISPLPNLEFKFVTANSLIPAPEKALEYDGYQKDIQRLEEIRKSFFQSSSADEKERLKEDFKECRKHILGESLYENIASWDPFDHKSIAEFFDGGYMFGVKSFDCVIGNPPYIKEADNKKLFEKTKTLRTYQGKMDIWYHFVGRGFDILKNKGILTFIATNNWTTNTGAKKLRNIILQESQIINLLDFGAYMCFDSASIQTMVMEFQKLDSVPSSYEIRYARIDAKKPTDEHRDAILAHQNFDDITYLTPTISPQSLFNQPLSFADSKQERVLEKILAGGSIFLEEGEVWQGLVHPQPYLNKNMLAKLQLMDKNCNLQVGDGIFNLSSKEIKALGLTKNEKNLLKPYYEANKLLKYYGEQATDIYVIYTEAKFNKADSMNKYPNLKNHLDRFQNVITSCNKPYGLHRARKQSIFEGEKILSRVKCIDCPIFTYVDFDCYVGLNFNIIKTNRIDIKLLTGILNSKLIAFWLRHKGKMQGNHYQVNQEPLLNIPIVKSDSKNKKLTDEVISLVERILESKAKDPKADTTKLESKIDSLVYRLYDLSEEEIGIIEGRIEN